MWDMDFDFGDWGDAGDWGDYAEYADEAGDWGDYADAGADYAGWDPAEGAGAEGGADWGPYSEGGDWGGYTSGEGYDLGGATDSGWDLSGVGNTLGNLGTSAANWAGRLLSGDANATRQAQMALGALGMLSSYNQNRRAAGAGGTMTPEPMRAMPGADAGSAATKAAMERFFTSPLTKYKQPPPSTFGGVDPKAPRYAFGGMVPMRMRSPLQRAAMQDPTMAVAPPPGALGRFTTGLDQPATSPGAAPLQQRAQRPRQQRYMHQMNYAGGGALLEGEAGGQDDVLDIRAAPGEYIFDADVVAALGDGSNEEGARKLDEFRQAIRAHKREAPVDDIPPRAKPLHTYLKD